MTELPVRRNISNSEVVAFLSCKRMYNYAFCYNIEPKITSTPLSRGTLGHLAFENYINARLNSSNHEQAMKAGKQTFIDERKNISVEILLETQFLWLRYMDFHQGWPEWELLGTEDYRELQITDNLYLALRYDAKVREKRTDKILIGDWKFTYDFWSPTDHDLNGQMPKYIFVLQANGERCDGGFLEEVRTRPLGKEKSADNKNLWRRTSYFPSIARKRSVLRQHVATSLEIETFRSLPEEERRERAIPVLNKHGACKYCNFKDLCNSELEGKKDLTLDMQINYKPNTYGYNNSQGVDLASLETLI